MHLKITGSLATGAPAGHPQAAASQLQAAAGRHEPRTGQVPASWAASLQHLELRGPWVGAELALPRLTRLTQLALSHFEVTAELCW
jgi:hydroxypyruvate isomerase